MLARKEGMRMAARRYGRRKCRCCRHWFMPQPHNAYHQRYCTQRGCRLASHRASQRRYNRKHPDRYKGSADVIRTQLWREAHPCYWRRTRRRHVFHIEICWDECRSRRRMRVVREYWRGGALRDLYRSKASLPRHLMAGLDRALHNLMSHLPAPC